MPLPVPVPAVSGASHRRHGDDPLAFLERLAATTREVVPFLVGRRQAFLLNRADAVDTVFVQRTHDFDKGPGYAAASRLLGAGLLTAEGAAHAARRRAVTPAFHRASLEASVPTIVRHAARCRHRWGAVPHVDLAEDMRALTLSIAAEALFGADSGPWTAAVSRALAGALAPVDGLVAILAPPASVRRARRDLDAVIDSILDERASAPPPQSPDLLSVLMEAGADREQVRDEVRTFLVAGHDTISHALTWTWLLLSANHDADERLGREVAMVLGSRLPESSDVAQLTYTRAVVKESLRLWPPAWVIVRRAKHAMSIAGQDIPAGALVVASPFVTHRDERYFPDPHTFDPGRWLVSGGEAGRPKQAYFPFGAGPRACVGEHFAWLEATLVLATLAQQWRAPSVAWDMVHPVARVTLRPGPLPSFTPSRRKWRGQASYHSTGAEVPLSQAPGAADGP